MSENNQDGISSLGDNVTKNNWRLRAMTSRSLNLGTAPGRVIFPLSYTQS